MIDPVPHYINERQSDLRGVKEGWYAIDDHGCLLFGPFFNQEKCLSRIGQSVKWSGDLAAKWGKFSEQELGALKTKDDLVTQVALKYGIEKTQAQRDVDSVMKGRQILNWIERRRGRQ